jgi:hypothetical protein
MASGSQSVRQQLKIPSQSVSNRLRSVNTLGEHLVEINSSIFFDKSPHSLRVSPGQFPEVLAEGEPFTALKQELHQERIFVYQDAGIAFNWHHFTLSPRIGGYFKRKRIESDLFLMESATINRLPDNFRNDLKNDDLKVFADPEIAFKKQKLTLKASFSLSWQQVQFHDKAISEKDKLGFFSLNPKFVADYQFKNFWRIRGIWNFGEVMENGHNIYYGYLLNSYRNLRKNNTPLSTKTQHKFSFYLSYRNPVTSFFNSLSAVRVFEKKSLVYDYQVQPNGTTVLQAIELPHSSTLQSINFYSSKYFSEQKSTFTVRASLLSKTGKSLLNEELLNTTTFFLNLKPSLDYNVTPWLNAEYKLDGSRITTKIEDSEKSNIAMWKHFITMFAFPANNQEISLFTEFYRYQSSSNLFADIEYRYTIPDKQVDIEFHWNNILEVTI